MAIPLIAAGIVARAVAKKLATRAAGGIVGAGAKSVNPVYKNIGSNVKVVPSKTAPKTGLENRGNKLTKSERVERAQDYKFDKQLGNYYRDMERRAGTHPDDMPKKPQAEGVKNARKKAAINKEAKSVIKINSNPMRGK
jgi:hypothetical protein